MFNNCCSLYVMMFCNIFSFWPMAAIFQGTVQSTVIRLFVKQKSTNIGNSEIIMIQTDAAFSHVRYLVVIDMCIFISPFTIDNLPLQTSMISCFMIIKLWIYPFYN